MNADAVFPSTPAPLLNGESFFLWELGQRRVIEHWMDQLYRSNGTLTIWLEQEDPALAALVEETFPLCNQAKVASGVPEAATDASTFVNAEGVIQLQRGTDIVPCLPDQPATLTWFAMVRRWLADMQKLGTSYPELETMVAPGVIIGHHCSISKDTVLNAPCWIGSGCTISGATIGPNAVIGEGCVIAAGAHITESYVLSRNFVRPNTRMDGVVVCSDRCIDLATGGKAAMS